MKQCCIRIRCALKKFVRNFSVLFLVIWPFIVFGQTGYQISGKVTNWDGEPLIGANVLLHELSIGTLTDVEGAFSFSNIRPNSYHLHITFVGHESVSKTILIRDKSVSLDIRLKESTVELNELLIEANPFKSGPVEQSMTIETVGRDFLNTNDRGTLAGALQKLPGMNVINTGVGIAKPVIRGMSFNRVLVNDKGIKQEGQQWGGDHGLEIDQYEPDRIEIIKGPASLLYGSDAMGGVINIQAAPIPNEGSLTGSLQSVFKSNNNLYGSSLSLQGNRKGKFFSLRLSVQDFADYKIPADTFSYNTFVYKIADNKLENTAGNELNFSGAFGLSGNWGYSKLTVSNFHQKSGIFPGAMGAPGEYNPVYDGRNRNVDMPRQVVNHFKIISNTNLSLGRNWLEIDLGYQENVRREEGEPHSHGFGSVPEGTLALGLTLKTYSLNAKYHYQVDERYSAIYGVQAQYQTNAFKGFEFLLPAFKSSNIGVYSYHEYNINDSWTINGGLRGDWGMRDIRKHIRPRFDTEDPRDSTLVNNDIQRTFIDFSGAVGLSYYPHHNFNAKLNIGTSFKMPTAPELSMNGQHHGTFRYERGNEALDSERGIQADVNLTYHTPALHIGLTPYFSYYDQFIYLKPQARFADEHHSSNQVYQYMQNDAVFTGGELSTEYHFIPNLHLKIAAEYVWNLNIDSKRPLPFTPPFSLLGEVRYDIPLTSETFSDAYAGLDAHFFSAQNRVDQNEKTTPAYEIFSFNAGVKFKIRNQKASFRFSIQNLFDEKYLNHLSRYRLLSLPEQGRNYVISLNLPFDLQKK